MATLIKNTLSKLGATLVLLSCVTGCGKWDAKPPAETKSGQHDVEVADSLVEATVSINTKSVADEFLAKYRNMPLAEGVSKEISAKLLVEEKTTIQKAVDYVVTPYKAAGCITKNVVTQCPKQVVHNIKERCFKHLRPWDCFKTVVVTEMVPCAHEVQECWPEVKEVINSRLEPVIDLKEKIIPTSIWVHHALRLTGAQITAIDGGINVTGRFKIAFWIDVKQGILSESVTVKGALKCESEFKVDVTAKAPVTSTPSIDLELTDFKFDLEKLCFPGAVEVGEFWLSTPGTYVTKELLGPPIKKALVKVLNEQLHNTVSNDLDFKDEMSKLWSSGEAPIKLGSDLWLQISPNKIWLSQFKAAGTGDANELLLNVGIGARPTVVLATTAPEATHQDVLIGLRNDLNNQFYLSARGTVPLPQAQERLEAVVDQALRDKLHGNLVQRGVRVYQSGDHLVLALTLATSPEAKPLGTVYLSAEPYVDEGDRTVRLRNVVFDVDSKRVLVKTASWLLSGSLEKLIESNAIFEYGGTLHKLEEATGHRPMETASENGLQNAMAIYRDGHFHQKSKAVDFDGVVSKIEAKNLWVEKDTLAVYAQARGTLNVTFSPKIR